MSVRNCMPLAARLSAALLYRTRPAAPIAFKVNDVTNQQLIIPRKISAPPQLSILPRVICLANAPTPKPRIEIIDPLANIWSQKKTPTRQWGHSEVSLPNTTDEELVEPPKNDAIEKRAARLIVIRRRKMKKHKWRKLYKKMKFVFARRRQKREMAKEKAFQAMLLSRIKEAEDFQVEEYVASRIKTAHWEKPITRVRGFFAPDWVIRDHLKGQEEERRIKERIEECLRLQKKLG